MHINKREMIIDLHGIHVSEAIYVLKHGELAVMKNAARSVDQPLWLYISVRGKSPHEGFTCFRWTSYCCSALPIRGRRP